MANVTGTRTFPATGLPFFTTGLKCQFMAAAVAALIKLADAVVLSFASYRMLFGSPLALTEISGITVPCSCCLIENTG